MEIDEALKYCLLMDDYEFPLSSSDSKVTITISSFRGYGVAIHYYGSISTSDIKGSINIVREYDKIDRKHDLRYHSDRGGAKYFTKIGEKTGRWRNRESLIDTCMKVAKTLFPNREIELKDTTR
jgi:hypothetical protein